VELAGTDPARITTEGMGPDQPLEDNGTPAGRALKRRVEITVGS
jgi:outer membrane protein OmpA-like peptidoglycan-associated protein